MLFSLYESEVEKRRKELFDEIIKDHGVTLIINYQHQNIFTQQKPYPHYLAHWLNLPFYQDFVFIIQLGPNQEMKTTLAIHRDDHHKIIWEGQDSDFEQASTKYQIDRIVDHQYEYLREFLIDNRKGTIFYHDISDKPDQTDFNQLIVDLTPSVLQPGVNLLSPEEIIDNLRVVKSDFEIEMIWEACQISREAHINVLQNIKPGLNESYLDGIFTGHVKMKGCSKTAYPNIIGSGINSTTIHYHQNNQDLKDGDLLLIDAGAEYHGYASDITRTYPVNGKFTQVQRNIYSLVLEVQKTCIEMIRPGINFNDLQNKAVELITKGLVDLGLLIGELNNLILNRAGEKFFMHGIGHWMGLQVHDCPLVPTITWSSKIESTKFQAGMVLTIEPGIYIGKYLKIDKFVNIEKYKEYYGIGVRIEDNILVTTNGYKVLSQGIPKEIDEIEHFISKE